MILCTPPTLGERRWGKGWGEFNGGIKPGPCPNMVHCNWSAVKTHTILFCDWVDFTLFIRRPKQTRIAVGSEAGPNQVGSEAGPNSDLSRQVWPILYVAEHIHFRYNVNSFLFFYLINERLSIHFTYQDKDWSKRIAIHFLNMVDQETATIYLQSYRCALSTSGKVSSTVWKQPEHSRPLLTTIYRL